MQVRAWLGRLPMWVVPAIALVICVAAGEAFGPRGAGIAGGVVALVVVSTLGADLATTPKARHIAQVAALAVAAAVVLVSVWRLSFTTHHHDSTKHASGTADFRGKTPTPKELDPDLHLANLRGAVLAGDQLGGFHLESAYAQGADFDRAYLAGAHLGGAHLAGATFRSACLRGADLSGADLSGADFTGANVASVAVTEKQRKEARVWPAKPDADVC